MNFFENRLSVGVGVKARMRGGIAHDFSLEDIQAFSGSDDDDSSETQTESCTVESNIRSLFKNQVR